jgi:hypothetical protein
MRWFSTFSVKLIVLTSVLSACGDRPQSATSPAAFPAPNKITASPRPDEIEQIRKEEVKIVDVLDHFAARSAVRSLRKKSLPHDVREVRIWLGFGPDVTRGLILGDSSASYLPPVGDVGREKRRPPQSLRPADGWGKFWSEMEESGLLELSEEPIAERVEPSNDSIVMVVEMKKGDDYRYLFYPSPCRSNWPSAKDLLRSVATIERSFGVEFYNCP